MLEQAIEQTALADVGPADNGQSETVVDEFAVGEAVDEAGDADADGPDALENLVRTGYGDVVFGEVDAGFEQSDEFEELILERGDGARN